MSKKCELTGKIPLKGHKVSHANNKTKRRFLPNLKNVKFKSEILNKNLRLTVSNAGVRSVDKKGSFDQFIKENLPIGKFGWPEPVGDLVTFLASQNSGFLTGTCINIDGGWSRSIN